MIFLCEAYTSFANCGPRISISSFKLSRARSERLRTASQRLRSLLKEIETSRHADQGKIGAEIGDDGLSVSVNRQAVGLWRVEGPDLALYRPGSAAAECHVSNSYRRSKNDSSSCCRGRSSLTASKHE